jgi:meiotic recombination protein REC8, fungi type
MVSGTDKRSCSNTRLILRVFRLAATFGPNSSLKKLPRRLVLAADIGSLCNQISEPKEPLALRLSSNLMVGVAR